MSSNSSSRLLAVCRGPTVSTWDTNHVSSSPSSFNDAKSVVDDDPTSGLICQFNPHGNNAHVADVAWNHNCQVLATCSNSSNPKDDPSVVLTYAPNGSTLETVAGRQQQSPNDTNNTTTTTNESITSVSFGGRSRYLSLSTTHGIISIWDMKKKSRVRLFQLTDDPQHGSPSRKKQRETTTTSSSLGECRRAVFDPSDTFVAGISSSSSDGSLRLFKLREGHLVRKYVSPGGGSRGGATAMEFSTLQATNVAVGTRDGSLLVYDVASSATTGPTCMMKGQHGGVVTGVSFSPSNKVLLASSSEDGRIGFHDVKSQKTVQWLQPLEKSSRNNNGGGGGGGIKCLSFHSDGITLAAGTGGRTVVLYDLRRAATGRPLAVWEALSTEEGVGDVKCVQFVNRSGSSSSSQGGGAMSTVKKQRQQQQQEKEPVVSKIAGERNNEREESSEGGSSQPQHSGSQSSSQEKLTMGREEQQRLYATAEVKTTNPPEYSSSTATTPPATSISKIQISSPQLTQQHHLDNQQQLIPSMEGKESSLPKSYETVHTTSTFKLPPPETAVITSREVHHFDHKVFQNNDFVSTTTTQQHNSSHPTNHAATTPRFPPPLSQQSPSSSTAKSPQYSPHTTPHKNVFDFNNTSLASLSPSKDQVDYDSIKTSMDRIEDDLRNLKSSTQRSGGVGVVVPPANEIIDSKIETTNANVLSGGGVNGASVTATFSNGSDGNGNIVVNKLVLQNIIENAIDNMKDETENAIRNLHIDIIRQFQNQSDRIEKLFQKQTKIVTGLVEENKLLREENERLRSNY